ncbi:23S rRNA (pseudouridine(1915)-N(3))-methyltransferase RlmH [Helicobacter bilis]|uniref:23S rRNA (pseudouridine(1915)-N(3))-methyltransferase RlmH n=1 Tax=Helicobacter bilis TaxID=37372 RepID=UPI00248F3E84|nr:23S rRNA (pseudouridine(1915)-N(3))-methyltransferase RlmH [Helicobacter bilis]
MQYYSKACKGFGATLSFFNMFNKRIQEAQKQDSNIAKQSYTMAFSKYLDKQSVLLDAEGEKLTSIGFSRMIESYSTQSGIIKFFIAGAFGFEKEILKRHKTISLSTLTFSHEIAKIVLLEQIYRSLSIINKHPYHKL